VRFSPTLALYLAAGRAAGPLVRRMLLRRARRGKEDPARLGERLGRAGRARPEGPLVWLHGASVGEGLSMLGLIEALGAARPDLKFLATTGTVTSAKLMAARLPEGAVHQYAPVDLGSAVTGFLDHWRPDLCIWVESEFWPGLIHAASARGAPLALVNARVSAGSERGWRHAPGLIRALLGRFEVIAAQTAETAARLERLGAPAGRVAVTGSLKAGIGAPDAGPARVALAAEIGERPVWLAASTHAGEEVAAAEAHGVAAAAVPGLLTIIAPRHPERGAEIAETLRGLGHTVALRSRGEAVTAATGIYVADTLGEIGAWLRLAEAAFVGGSLALRGGHNPYEPAMLNVPILHGPDTANFAVEYEALATAGGARAVRDGPALGRALAGLLADPGARLEMSVAARAALGDGAEALDKVMALLTPLLPEARR
jgi:3-deoxy-D-manno-octulosonic-acid transferase